MAFQKRLSILLDYEIKDFYGTPSDSTEEQRVYFSLNDIEAKAKE